MKKVLLLLAFLLVSLWMQAKQYIPITFNHEGLTLNGTLILPNSLPPYTAIVIHSGSGANDRYGTLPMYGGNVSCLYPALAGDTLKPYLGLGEALADSGYAVLIYDKVEFTYPNPSPVTFKKLWLTSVSAIKYLRTRTDIDTNAIAMIGHSEGSSIVPYVVRFEPSVKAVISLAGPRRPIDSVLAYQLKYIAQTCGGDVNAAEAQGNQVMQYGDDIRTGNWNASTPPLFGVPAAVWSDYFKVVDSVAINYNLANRHSLFIGLGDDINVPVNIELARFQNEVSIGADFYTLPGLNHYLTTANDPSTSQLLTDTIVYWLRKKMFPADVQEIRLNNSKIEIGTSEGKLIIQCTEPIKAINIYDLAGKLVRAVTLNSRKYEIQLSSFQPALYLVHISSGNSSKVHKLRID